MEAAAVQKVRTIEVRVNFPLSTRPPYHHKDHENDTIGSVRVAAMEHFRVHEEPGSEYYLTDDGHDDQRLPDSETVGQAAGEKHELALTLVKDLVQG
jgi:hypothetical protein